MTTLVVHPLVESAKLAHIWNPDGEVTVIDPQDPRWSDYFPLLSVFTLGERLPDAWCDQLSINEAHGLLRDGKLCGRLELVQKVGWCLTVTEDLTSLPPLHPIKFEQISPAGHRDVDWAWMFMDGRYPRLFADGRYPSRDHVPTSFCRWSDDGLPVEVYPVAKALEILPDAVRTALGISLETT